MCELKADAEPLNARSQFVVRWLTVCLLMVALAMRLYHLTGPNLWYDEVFCVDVAQKGPVALVFACVHDIHPPLFFVLLKAWLFLTGTSIAAMRLLPVFLSAISLVLAYRLASRTKGPFVACCALAWLAVAPHQIYYANEVRMYSLLTATTLAAALFYRRWLDGGESNLRDLAGYVGCGLASIYTHYFGLLWLAALNLHYALLVRADRPVDPDDAAHRKRIRQWLKAQGMIALGYLPWLPLFLWHAGRRQPWRRPLTLTETLWNDAQFVTTAYVGNVEDADGFWETLRLGGIASGGNSDFDIPLWRWIQLAGLSLFLVLLALGFARSLFPGRKRTERDWFWPLLCGVPIAAGSLLSMRQNLDLSRYLLFVTPGLFIVASSGLALCRHLVWRALGLACCATGLLAGAADYYSQPSRDTDLRPILDRIAHSMQPGDRIIIDPDYMDICLSFYAERYKLSDSIVAAPHLPNGNAQVEVLRGDVATARFWLIADYHSRWFHSSEIEGPFRVRSRTLFTQTRPRAQLFEIERTDKTEETISSPK